MAETKTLKTKKPKFEIGLPKDTPEYMAPAYFDCLRWAAGDAKVIKRFREETGNRFVPGRTPIEAMIDESTGTHLDFVEKFVIWFNENVWGPMG